MAFVAGKCHLAEYGKQQATLSISHAQNRARSGYAMARKGAMKWNLHASRVTILLHGKQQNTTLRLGHSFVGNRGHKEKQLEQPLQQ